MKRILFLALSWQILFSHFVSPGFSTPDQDHFTLMSTILEKEVPQDCAEIFELGERYLQRYSARGGAGEVMLKILECEQDWDVIREKLHHLIRQYNREPVAEKAHLTYIRYLFLKGIYDAVSVESEKFVLTFPDSEFIEEALYLEGVAHFELGQYDQANQKFLLLILRYPQSSYVGQAQFGIAESYYHSRKFSDALAQFKLARKKLTNDLFIARTELRIASCHHQLDNVNRSIQHYQKVIDIYPQSPERKTAEAAIQSLKGKSTVTHKPDEIQETDTMPGGSMTPGKPPSTKRVDPAHTCGYTIQVGAFAQKQNAFDLLEALKIKGYDAYALTIERSNRVIYKIRIGTCLPKNEAKKISDKLLKEEQLFSFLTLCPPPSKP
ncbi:tetratricopeptide repeat protein [candidate division CSSED10-310 bacterium]|uniref:Tetratricopeptide repeat protein n=1 Tax=candidate division CSSED10-310 bacterium TaxID=2855610 RepID=A0ABV6YUR7_UNCC1